MPVELRAVPLEVHLGIDLGTTNSVAYFSRGGQKSQQIQESDGSGVIPSVVCFRRNGESIGKIAKRRIGDSTSSAVFNAKRLIGRVFNDQHVQESMELCGSKIVDKEGKPAFHIPVINQDLTPVDIGTKIVKYIIDLAEKKADAKVTRVCITVPAHFDGNQRTATQRCVMNCGFTQAQVDILNEPTAAALRYVEENEINDGHLLVYDLGGGTFDVSILKITNGHIKVLKYDGNNSLGGSNFDKLIADLIVEKYTKMTRVGLFDDQNERQRNAIYRRLIIAAEEAKKELSRLDETTVDICSILGIQAMDDDDSDGSDGSDDDDDDDMTIYQKEMNDLLSPLINDTVKTVTSILQSASLKPDQITKVILVGGSSRLPIVTEKLLTVFDKSQIVSGVNIDTCVAEGACWYLDHPIDISEVTAYSLGQQVRGGQVQWIVPTNTRLPYTGEAFSLFTPDTVNKDQTVVSALYQGQQEILDGTLTPVKECICLHPYSFSAYRPTAREVHVKTIFHIEMTGIVYVTVEEVDTKKKLLENYKIEW